MPFDPSVCAVGSIHTAKTAKDTNRVIRCETHKHAGRESGDVNRCAHWPVPANSTIRVPDGSCRLIQRSSRTPNSLTQQYPAPSALRSSSRTCPFRCPGAGACSRKGCIGVVVSGDRRPGTGQYSLVARLKQRHSDGRYQPIAQDDTQGLNRTAPGFVGVDTAMMPDV